DDRSVRIAIAAGDEQFGLRGGLVEEPLQVIVTDPANSEPVEDIEVTWRVTSGSGIVVPVTSTTDALGVAETGVRLGDQLETVTVEATVAGLIGEAATFVIHVVDAPVIEAITPMSVQGGGSVTITGTGFPTDHTDATVLFDGLRGQITSGAPGLLVVTVPRCVLTRTAQVRVQLGGVASEPVAIQTTAVASAGIRLETGTALRLNSVEDLACLRFDASPAGSAYLIVPQNASDVPGVDVLWELNGHAGAGQPITASTATRESHVAADWELALRARERALVSGGPAPFDAHGDLIAARVAAPEIGDRRDFNVLTRTDETERITAEVRAISERAILYVDLQAPAQGFSQQDLLRFGGLFDDPIYATDVAVFGTPSDVDGNGKIIILFTPTVNALTESGESSFIAGYFFGCDLVTAARCAETNRAEIFYSMVPDPEGSFGDARSNELVLSTVPGILAHEFQHMIHFGQKGNLDVLWLSEGLAHAAEDIVGRVFLARGDSDTALEFMRPNHLRANRYLGATGSTSLVGADSPGTLELRGGAWLLVDYLAAHYGGDALLGRLTRTDRSGVANVTAETGQSWDRLLGDFALALWADGAPELQN
ncbi:MAG: IPT/TIG domain-containing protein, partial [Longimicrobiales bacterium]